MQPERERPENIPGAVVRVRLDLEHWLASGTDGEVQAIVEGQRVFTPLKLDKGTNVGTYVAKDKLVVGGLAWDEAQAQLAQKAFLMHQAVGQGHIVAFAEEPNYRAFTEATQLLFANAVLLGVAYCTGGPAGRGNARPRGVAVRGSGPVGRRGARPARVPPVALRIHYSLDRHRAAAPLQRRRHRLRLPHHAQDVEAQDLLDVSSL